MMATYAIQIQRVSAIPLYVFIAEADTHYPACQRLEGSEVTVEIGVSFGAGVEIPVHEALSNGLNFGVSVAWSTTKSRGTQESCPISKDAKPYQNPCVCGMQYKAYRQRATGTQFADNACGEEVNPQDFNVTSAVLVDSGEGDDQTPQVEWRTCRSSKSKCSNIEDMDPCAGDL